ARREAGAPGLRTDIVAECVLAGDEEVAVVGGLLPVLALGVVVDLDVLLRGLLAPLDALGEAGCQLHAAVLVLVLELLAAAAPVLVVGVGGHDVLAPAVTAAPAEFRVLLEPADLVLPGRVRRAVVDR